LSSIVRNGGADSVHLSLEELNNSITLTVDDNALAYHTEGRNSKHNALSTIALAAIKERTMLSGGSFSIGRNTQGGTTASSSWLV